MSNFINIDEVELYIDNICQKELLKKIPNKSIDCVATDVPYGMNFQSNNRKVKHKKIENDDNLNWLPDWVKEIKRIIKPNGHIYIFCSWHKIDIFKIELEKYFKIKNILVWVKKGGGMGDLEGGYGGAHEFCIFINLGNSLNGKRDSDVIDKAYRTGNKLHPTQKPVEIMEYLIEKSTERDDIVLDCFSGSGTTAVACYKTGRRFIGCEIDKEHYENSIKRLDEERSQMTMQF